MEKANTVVSKVVTMRPKTLTAIDRPMAVMSFEIERPEA
jgi:hypothetical protein